MTAGVYQVRGLDRSNMTIVEGDRGVLVIDPLIRRDATHNLHNIVTLSGALVRDPHVWAGYLDSRASCGSCARLWAMTRPPTASVLEPFDVAVWLDVDIPWVMRAIERDGLPVLGYRSDGTPLLAADEVRAWLRRPSKHDDET